MRRNGLLTAHNFLRNSGYISTWNKTRVSSHEELLKYADDQNVTEFILLNDADINFYKWHYKKTDCVWMDLNA